MTRLVRFLLGIILLIAPYRAADADPALTRSLRAEGRVVGAALRDAIPSAKPGIASGQNPPLAMTVGVAGPLTAAPLAAASQAPLAPAAPGDLDLGFGDGGKVTFDLAGSAAAITVLPQPNGRITLAGGATVPGALNWPTFVRLTSDGRRDPDFGMDGVVVDPACTGPYTGVGVD